MKYMSPEYASSEPREAILLAQTHSLPWWTHLVRRNLELFDLQSEFAANQERLSQLHESPDPPAVARLLRDWKRLVTTRVSRAEADWIRQEFPAPLRPALPPTLSRHPLPGAPRPRDVSALH